MTAKNEPYAPASAQLAAQTAYITLLLSLLYSLLTMLASEAVLAREWDSPEEDEAWADL